MIRSASGLVVLLPLLAVAVPGAPADDKEAKSEAPFEMSKQEQEILELTNKERAKEKLPALKPNPVLFRVARAHSANMAKQEKMEHILDGKTPGQRVLAAGYDYGKVTENIAASDMPKVPLEMVMKTWMESKLHHDNILNPQVSEIGIGIGRSQKGELYFTQVFARPRKVVKPDKDQ
jgi:uncharacterized protein YkwD